MAGIRLGCFSLKAFKLKLQLPRFYSDRPFIPFANIVKKRQHQAKKSVLVQVNSELSFPELHSYCSQFGTICGIHHYTIPNNCQHFMLVEFHKEEEASNLILSTCFTDETDVIPVQSSFMWFRPPPHGFKNNLTKLNINTNGDTNLKLRIENGCDKLSETAIIIKLLNKSNMYEQMEELYQLTHLNDLGTRLRFLAARQIECALTGLFPKVVVYPFGSSVNGFGKTGCDLDLVMKFTNEELKDEFKGRLVYHVKKSVTSGRLQHQRYMEIISDMIQIFVPGCNYVRRILQARIPIIKYNQEYTGLECDLSISTLSGLYMSELLYIYGCLDKRVKHLVFTVRKWAQCVGLTNSIPGKWITNFPLTLMVLFFLQNAPDGPILPSFNYLKKCAGKDDTRQTDDFINCTFIRNINNIEFHTNNNTSMDKLLFQFFEFYSSFDFMSKSISINEGKSINKTDHSPLYIINPLEIGLNVSKNISFDECERIKTEFRTAAWLLDSYDKKGSNDYWGIASIFYKNKTNDNHTTTLKRIVAVEDLFDSTKNTASNYEKFNQIEKEKNIDDFQILNKKPNIVFKNLEVKMQIEKIENDKMALLKHSNRLIDRVTRNYYILNGRKVRRR